MIYANKHINKMSLLIVIVLIFIFACGEQTEKADLIILDGQIFTGDETNLFVEALAVTGDRILKAGSKKDILKLKTDLTKIINLNGKFAIPGFIEGHAHFLSLGYFKMRLDLNTATSWEQIVEMVKNAAEKAEPGEWIEGRGWHVDKWKNKPLDLIEGNPIHRDLSKVAPDNPVYLKHASGHSAIINKKAIDVANISKTTPDPDGGKIIRFANQQPTGVLLENATELIEKVLTESADNNQNSIQNKKNAIQLAVDECLKHGITSFQDAGAMFEDIDLFRKMIGDDQIKLRLWVMLDGSNKELHSRIKDYHILNEGNYLLTVRAIKEYIDGALGSRGALLLEPYTDMPSVEGFIATPIQELEKTAQLALENNFQLCIHAIGDRGNREVLNLYEAAFESSNKSKDLRWRIEHAQHLNRDDIIRFVELGVIASMQPIHCISDGPWVPKRLGDERTAAGAYRWQDLLKSGVVVSCGTDAPVESVDPIANFYAAVTRKMKNRKLFYPDQKMTRLQALKSMTINAAYAAFEENIKGSLTEGKLADITILSENLLEVAEEKIAETQVLYTILGGEIVYKSPVLNKE